MRRTVLAALCVTALPIGAACSAGDSASEQSSTSANASTLDDDQACESLQGSEPSQIPEAVEYSGLDGSVRFLRQRSGVNLEGDVFVYLKPENATELDELAAGIAKIDGAKVLGRLDQAEVYREFVDIYGERGAEVVTPSILPPVVAVAMLRSEARTALEGLTNRPAIYDVVFRDEVAARLLAAVRLVQDQFDEELRMLQEVGRRDVQDAAEALEGLGSPASTPSSFPLEVIAATEVLMGFVDVNCPLRPSPMP